MSIVHFSCGAASAVCVLLELARCHNTDEMVKIVYADPGTYKVEGDEVVSGGELPDNHRFMRDMEALINKKVIVAKSKKFSDVMDVFKKGRKVPFLGSSFGAPCTYELKKIAMRDLIGTEMLENENIFGYCLGEEKRHFRFIKNNPEIRLKSPLIENKLSKSDCLYIIKKIGIKLPKMYLMGYSNANCPGCVKIGRTDYWAAIRRDFPELFSWFAKTERDIEASLPEGTKEIYSICGKKKKGLYVPLFLDEIPENARIQRAVSFSCGYSCGAQDQDIETEVIKLSGGASMQAKEKLGIIINYLNLANANIPEKGIGPEIEIKKQIRKLF